MWTRIDLKGVEFWRPGACLGGYVIVNFVMGSMDVFRCHAPVPIVPPPAEDHLVVWGSLYRHSLSIERHDIRRTSSAPRDFVKNHSVWDGWVD